MIAGVERNDEEEQGWDFAEAREVYSLRVSTLNFVP